MLSDIASPQTYSAIEVFYFTNCTQTVTAKATALIAGTAFTADPITFQFPTGTPGGIPPDLIITYNYPQIHITSLTELEPLTFVLACSISLIAQTNTITGIDTGANGGGSRTYCPRYRILICSVTVPIQLFTRGPAVCPFQMVLIPAHGNKLFTTYIDSCTQHNDSHNNIHRNTNTIQQGCLARCSRRYRGGNCRRVSYPGGTCVCVY